MTPFQDLKVLWPQFQAKVKEISAASKHYCELSGIPSAPFDERLVRGICTAKGENGLYLAVDRGFAGYLRNIRGFSKRLREEEDLEIIELLADLLPKDSSMG